MVDGLAGYRSVFWQKELWKAVRANKGTAEQVPILLIQGFTDDLFPLTEALRMYQTLRSIDPDYPVAAYFGDIGHPRAANKPAEMQYVLGKVMAWFDHYVKGTGAAPALGVAATITRPAGVAFNAADVVQVSGYDSLATISTAVAWSSTLQRLAITDGAPA